MNKNPSILIFGNYPPPYGGVPAHLKLLAPYLAQSGWNVHVLSMVGNKNWGHTPPQAIDGCTVHRPTILDRLLSLAHPGFYPREYLRFRGRDRLGWKTSLHTLSLSAHVKKIVSEHEINLISAYHFFSAGLVSYLIAKEVQIPFVITIFGEIYADPAFYLSRKSEVALILEASARIFSPSPHCAKSIELIDIDAFVEPIYHAIDAQFFKPDLDGSRVRARFGISSSDPVVIFVGRMVREMGLHVLLEAIPEVIEKKADVRFLIVGKSDQLEENAKEIEKRFPENVFVAPNLETEQLPLFQAAADIAVVPSINDRACLGLSIAEAMASENPVIVSDVGGGPIVIEDGISGILFPPGDSLALAASIVSLLNTQLETRIAMGKAGRQRVLKLFDNDTCNRKMEAAFREVLK